MPGWPLAPAGAALDWTQGGLIQAAAETSTADEHVTCMVSSAASQAGHLRLQAGHMAGARADRVQAAARCSTAADSATCLTPGVCRLKTLLN